MKMILPQTSNTGPSLTFFNGRPFMAYTAADLSLRILANLDTGQPSQVVETIVKTNGITELSNHRPSLLGFPQPTSSALESPTTSLYIAWTGTDGRLNVASSGDSVSFLDKTIFDETSVTKDSPKQIVATTNLGIPIFSCVTTKPPSLSHDVMESLVRSVSA